jgi:hypothetical protein
MIPSITKLCHYTLTVMFVFIAKINVNMLSVLMLNVIVMLSIVMLSVCVKLDLDRNAHWSQTENYIWGHDTQQT